MNLRALGYLIRTGAWWGTEDPYLQTEQQFSSYELTPSDTGLTQTDSIVAAKSFDRTASDTGITSSDSLVRTAAFSRSISDTGSTASDSIDRQYSCFRTASDAGLNVTDSIYSAAGRSASDTALAQSDTLAGTAHLYRDTSDTGLSIADAILSADIRTASDTGLTQSDSLARGLIAGRSLSDTGVTQTDSLNASISSDSYVGVNWLALEIPSIGAQILQIGVNWINFEIPSTGSLVLAEVLNNSATSTQTLGETITGTPEPPPIETGTGGGTPSFIWDMPRLEREVEETLTSVATSLHDTDEYSEYTEVLTVMAQARHGAAARIRTENRFTYTYDSPEKQRVFSDYKSFVSSKGKKKDADYYKRRRELEDRIFFFDMMFADEKPKMVETVSGDKELL